MRKVMDAVMAGRFDYEKAGYNQADFDNGSLEFSALSIDLSLKKGEHRKGTFEIYAPAKGLAEGFIYSSEVRMECLAGEFVGTKEEIPYCFSAEGLEEGDVIEGRFYIISNYGEYELPYRVEIEHNVISSQMGNIKNMFHFANLAKSNWEEAVHIFYSKEFAQIFRDGTDRQYYSAYKGLSAVSGNEQNVEEFLLEINKKQKVEYVPEKTEIFIDDPADTAKYSLTITKNGWGYTFLRIETEGEFLTVEKETAMDNEFLGNSFHLGYCIDSGKLHDGRNFGSIHIYNAYVDITIPVTVVCNVEHRRSYGIRKEKKRLLVQLMDYYGAFRAKKISSRTWMAETEKLVDRLAALDAKDIQTRLFQAQLLITQERFNEAKWQMDRLKAEIDIERCRPEIKCYYWYLMTLYSEDGSYVDEAVRRVERVFHANQDNWRIAWLMLHLSEEYTKSAARRWLMLEDQFKKGCVSPVLYIEAWHLLSVNPTLLMKLNPFEMQVLNFAAKKDLLTQDVIVQIRYQVQKLKGYSGRAFYILKECYEKYPDKETLQALCALLIKGNKTDSGYFEWYSLGVEQELRITKLYEYYMMSLPEDYKGEIPKMILMYFAYQSELDYRKNAFLYAYVYRKREENPEYYIKFCTRIESFVLNQVYKGRINKDLAYLYRNIITPALVNKESAAELAPLLFTHLISTENKELRYVIVGYAISKKEHRYPISDGRAMVPLYGDDYKILLEDGRGNRYTVSVPFRTERMMLPGKLLAAVSPFVTDQPGIDIYMCEGNKSFMDITRENVDRFRHIAAAAYIEEERRNEICLKLIHYYYEQDYMRELDGYLEDITPEGINDRERNEIIRFMVIRGMYDKAFLWIKKFGVHGADIKTLVRLCSRVISRDGFVEDRQMTQIVYFAFARGKYDGNLISYLVCFYNGTLKQMRDIWRAAEAFEVDTYALCERILIQMMFSGSFIGERTEIFKKYVSGGAKTEVEGAFLAQCAYDYFVKEKLIDPFIFADAIRVYDRGEKLHKVCKLALLKYYAENKEEITPKIRAAIRLFLEEMMEDNIYFTFFKEYVRHMPVMEKFLDKTFVEYKTLPGSKVVIHYIIERGRYTETQYRREEMRDMYGGVYVKAFILFFGERLQYYITEEKDGKEQLTESASINKSDIMQEEGDNRFSLINDIVVGQTLQDYNTVDHLLEEYYRKDYIVSRIFHLQ